MTRQADMVTSSVADAPGERLLGISGLSVHYGPVRALHKVSLAVHRGEAVALIGANGGGKSTLFKAIVGLLKVTEGDVTFEGDSMLRLSPQRRVRRGIGYSPEGRRVFPGLTVRENLEVACFASAGDRSERIDEAFALFPVLAERQTSFGWQLSGGQQQMVAIARALMGNPRLLLLDEPSLGLSPKLADEVAVAVRAVVRRGTSVLLAEQNVIRSLGCCDRAYVLEVGNIVLSGASDTLRNSDAVKRAYLGG
jgi:branched-chain amino acid transport system ATP-binding protein